MKNFLILEDYIIRSPFKMGEIWYGRVRHAPSGKEFRFTTREKDKRKATQFVLEEVKRWIDRDKGNLPLKSHITFEKAADEWIGVIDVRDISKKTYKSAIKVCKEYFGKKCVGFIEVGDIERFFKNVEDDRGLQGRTKAKYYAILNIFFNWSLRRKYCKENPLEVVSLNINKSRRGIALELEEARRLLKTATTPCAYKITVNGKEFDCERTSPVWHLYLAVLIALHTGLRRKNVFGMRWRHIDFEKNKISFDADEMKGKSYFEIPIHPELKEVLLGFLKKKSQVNSENLVIGREISNFSISFSSLLKRAGLPHIRFHDFRHTFSTWLSTKVPYTVLQRLIGHSPSDVTFKYVHVPWEELVKAIEGMPRLLTANSESVIITGNSAQK